MLKNDDLAVLFRSVQEDTEGAFAMLFDVVARPLYAYCFAFTKDMDQAQDLLQRTMIVVFEKRHQFSDGNVVAWMFTIARNICRAWERENRRTISLDASQELLDGLMQTPDEQHGEGLDNDELEMLNAAISNLASDYRRVIVLRYFADMTTEEIAQAEEISTTLVRVRLYRARQRLQTVLSPLLRGTS